VRKGRVKKLSGMVSFVEGGELTLQLLLPLYLSLGNFYGLASCGGKQKCYVFSQKSLLCILKHMVLTSEII
jgi:hypothetical protein